jgi:hypothetical protein
VTIEDLLEQDRRGIHAAVTQCGSSVRWLQESLEAEDLLAVTANSYNLEDECADIRAFAKRHSGSEAVDLSETAKRLGEAAVTIRGLMRLHCYRSDERVIKLALEEARQAAILFADLRERMVGAVDASGEVERPAPDAF